MSVFRIACRVAPGLLLAISAKAVLPATPESSHPAVVLHRGVNTFPWLYRAKSADGKGGGYLLDGTFPYATEYTPEILAGLKAMGLDFIRIPIEPNPFLAVPPADRGRLIAQVMAAVHMANQQGLTAIVDFHPREGVPRWQADAILSSNDTSRLYSDVLVEMASALVAKPAPRAVLELMNEPPGGWKQADDDQWMRRQEGYVQAVRKVAPTLPLIVTGDKGGGIDGLLRLDPKKIDDPNILYSFHYYDPMVVTHQGATWGSKRYRPYLSGINYPPVKQEEQQTLARVQGNIYKAIPNRTQADAVWQEAQTPLRDYYESHQGPAQVEVDFTRVQTWAKAHHIAADRLLLGEFGVLRPEAPEESGQAWIKDVRTAAERDGFAWAFFNYEPRVTPDGFTMLQQVGPTPGALDAGIVQGSLGLSVPPIKAVAK